MAADVAIDPCGGCGIDKINVPGIHGFEFLHQITVPSQLILLMIIFGQVELVNWHDFGMDFLVSLIFLEGFSFKRQLALLIILIKYGRHILPTPGFVSRVVALPENEEQVLVGYASRVIINLDRFAVVSDAAIGRVFFLTARISDAGSDNSVHTPELGVRSPESAHRKCCGLYLR